MDRTDVQCITAMLLTSVGIGLNLVFLQTMAGLPQARWVLAPVLIGLAVGLTGLPALAQQGGRGMVFVERVWLGSLIYLVLSAFTLFAQPRFD